MSNNNYHTQINKQNSVLNEVANNNQLLQQLNYMQNFQGTPVRNNTNQQQNPNMTQPLNSNIPQQLNPNTSQPNSNFNPPQQNQMHSGQFPQNYNQYQAPAQNYSNDNQRPRSTRVQDEIELSEDPSDPMIPMSVNGEVPPTFSGGDTLNETNNSRNYRSYNNSIPGGKIDSMDNQQLDGGLDVPKDNLPIKSILKKPPQQLVTKQSEQSGKINNPKKKSVSTSVFPGKMTIEYVIVPIFLLLIFVILVNPYMSNILSQYISPLMDTKGYLIRGGILSLSYMIIRYFTSSTDVTQSEAVINRKTGSCMIQAEQTMATN